MTKLICFILFSFFSFLISFSQSNYSTQTSESLLKLKADAVKASDFTKAAEIKKELDIRDAEQKQINVLQADLDKKVKAEDFAGAAIDKKKLQELKDIKSKKDEIRKQIATAVAASDFDKAAKLKEELDTFYAPINGNQNSNLKTVNKKDINLKQFEGKLEYELKHNNVPEDINSKLNFVNSKGFILYKKGLRKDEAVYDFPGFSRTITKIYDFAKGELLYMEMTPLNKKGKAIKSATLTTINLQKPIEDVVNIIEETKVINERECHKVNYKCVVQNSSIEVEGYAILGFSVTGLYGQQIPFLFIEQNTHPSTNKEIISNWKAMSISEETLSDDLFSTIPPLGYEVKDERKTENGVSPIESNLSNQPLANTKLFASKAPIIEVTYTKDGKHVIGNCLDSTLIIWDISGQIKHVNKEKLLYYRIVTSPDGKVLAAVGGSTIKFWDISTGKSTKTYTYNTSEPSFFETLKYSVDGKYIISGCADNSIKIWDESTSQQVNTITGHTNRIISIDVSENGKYIVSGSADKTIKIWDIASGQCLKTLEGISTKQSTIGIASVAFNPNNMQVASTFLDNKGYGALKLWDIETGMCTKTEKGSISDLPSQIAFSPDGKFLSGKKSLSLELYNAVNLSIAKTYKGKRTVDVVFCSAFSPSGKFMAVGTMDSCVNIWKIVLNDFDKWEAEKAQKAQDLITKVHANYIGDYKSDIIQNNKVIGTFKTIQKSSYSDKNKETLREIKNAKGYWVANISSTTGVLGYNTVRFIITTPDYAHKPAETLYTFDGKEFDYPNGANLDQAVTWLFENGYFK